MRWEFGEASLPQQRRAASRLREVAGLVVAIEREHPEIDQLIGELERTAAALRAAVPTDVMPRVGPAADGNGRLYLDHSRDIGSFNPCFPEYRMTVEGDIATGSVGFPLVYEGPPGIVHGGFLALFFDCAMQHHNCDVGVAGKTSALALRYRRPTPIATELDFTIERSLTDGRITSTGRIELAGRVLCEAEMNAVAGDRADLPAVSPRRASDDE
jgi:acyl-coenzyme A thioesterase PaaI-like protein